VTDAGQEPVGITEQGLDTERQKGERDEHGASTP
jgi:hypothetical protein